MYRILFIADLLFVLYVSQLTEGGSGTVKLLPCVSPPGRLESAPLPAPLDYLHTAPFETKDYPRYYFCAPWERKWETENLVNVHNNKWTKSGILTGHEMTICSERNKCYRNKQTDKWGSIDSKRG